MQVQTSRRFDKEATERFFAAALEAARWVPGVGAAALTGQLPLSGDDEYGAHFESDDPATAYNVFRYAVSPGYPETTGIPLRRGHTLRRAGRGGRTASDSYQRVARAAQVPRPGPHRAPSSHRPRRRARVQYCRRGRRRGASLIGVEPAAVGIYGVLSGSVTERTREIGVRLALGASRGHILALILRQGMTLTGIGVVAGLCGAVAASSALVSLLFGVSRLDPAAYLGGVALLAVVSAATCWVPAWRGARVNPSITLRAE